MRHVLWSLAVLLSSGCCGAVFGKEVTRVALSKEGSGEATATLEAGDVHFWTDLAIEYTGNAGLSYRVELLQGGKPVATTTCNPLGHMSVKTSWVETNVGDSHSRKGMGKMDCTVKLSTAGATTVKTTLAYSTKPSQVTLTKADLVLKQ